MALSPPVAAVVLFSSDPASETLPFAALYKLEKLPFFGHFQVAFLPPSRQTLGKFKIPLDFSKPRES